MTNPRAVEAEAVRLWRHGDEWEGVEPVACPCKAHDGRAHGAYSGNEFTEGRWLPLARWDAVVAENAMLRKALERLTLASETLLSSDPDMPSHASTEQEFDAATDAARSALPPVPVQPPQQGGEGGSL